jgi:hypothetical protein
MTDEKEERRVYYAARTIERKRKSNRDAFIRAALAQAEGRDYFFWLLELCHLGVNPFTGNSLSTSFRCGEMNIGQAVQAHMIEAAPEAWVSMLREKEEERKNVERSREASATDSGTAIDE